jgi:FdhE protein
VSSIAPPSDLGDIPRLRLPVPSTLFARRAERFRKLSQGSAVGPYLAFLADVARAQGRALAVAGPVGLPESTGGPAIDLGSALGDGYARVLASITRDLARGAVPEATRQALSRLSALPLEAVEGQARLLVSGMLTAVDAAIAPFIAAALQVRLVTLAAGFGGELRGNSESDDCPLCDAPPVAGVVLGSDKLRYLACSMCAAEWHVTRIKCAHCGSTAGIGYFEIEGGSEKGVKAETCDGCRAYVKLFYLEARPDAEPLADDVATYALDVLLGERDYGKLGLNPMLVGNA